MNIVSSRWGYRLRIVYQFASGGKTLLYFTLIRGSAIIGSTESRHLR
jgi:hypothetical protein